MLLGALVVFVVLHDCLHLALFFVALNRPILIVLVLLLVQVLDVEVQPVRPVKLAEIVLLLLHTDRVQFEQLAEQVVVDEHIFGQLLDDHVNLPGSFSNLNQSSLEDLVPVLIAELVVQWIGRLFDASDQGDMVKGNFSLVSGNRIVVRAKGYVFDAVAGAALLVPSNFYQVVLEHLVDSDDFVADVSFTIQYALHHMRDFRFCDHHIENGVQRETRGRNELLRVAFHSDLKIVRVEVKQICQHLRYILLFLEVALVLVRFFFEF